MNETSDVEKIRAIQEAAQPCFQCGICSASCPVFRVAPEFNPRLAVDEIIQTGDVASGTEWYCTQCLKCDQRCPMGVSLVHILLDIKGISTQHGEAPRNVIEIMESILRTGIVGSVSGAGEKKRIKLELPELPRPSSDEIRTLLEVTSATETLAKYQDTGGDKE